MLINVGKQRVGGHKILGCCDMSSKNILEEIKAAAVRRDAIEAERAGVCRHKYLTTINAIMTKVC